MEYLSLGIENLIISLIELIIGEVSISLGDRYVPVTRKLLGELKITTRAS